MNKHANNYISTFKKYAVFKGRASRSEFWYFWLFNLLITIALTILESVIGPFSVDGDTLASIFQLVVLLPMVSVGVRRIHDVNKNGWYYIVPIYNFILFCTKGSVGNNEYGPEPTAY